MAWARAALGVAAAVAVGLTLVSGGSGTDPRTPVGLPGMPHPFLGTAVVGSGGLTAAVDAYGDVVDLRAPGPAGQALIENPADRQATGTVPADTGIVPRLSVGGGPALPLWRADSVSQRYLPGTNVVRTVARFGRASTTVLDAADEGHFARVVAVVAPPGVAARVSVSVNVTAGAVCVREPDGDLGGRGRIAIVCGTARSNPVHQGARIDLPGNRQIDSLGGPSDPASVAERAEMTIAGAGAGDRAWLRRARPLGPGAPAWATSMYERSLLTLRALTDRRTGAVAAGARDGWAYVWPRDAATAALAFAAAGYRAEARRVVDFLVGLRTDEAARFHGDGTAVPGRGPQGDAGGWIRAASLALEPNPGWRASPLRAPDYQEGDPGVYLGNVLAGMLAEVGGDPGLTATRDDAPEGSAGGRPPTPVAAIRGAFGTARGLVREAGDPSSGLDSGAAWAVRPFSLPPLHPAVRRTLLRLEAAGTPFGITPGEGWDGGVDPWTAPTAWSAWSLAALASDGAEPARANADRRAARALLTDLRGAATPAGALPERVNAHTGVPRSTTPLAWSHAFAILALRELWPEQ